MKCAFPVAILAAACAVPSSATESLPAPVRVMIEEAIRVDDPAKIDAVLEIAKSTYPAAAADIDAMHETYLQRRRSRDAIRNEEASKARRSAGMFELWDGKGELGASRSTGNTSNVGLSLGVTVDRKGIDWEHRLRARIDYLEDDISKRDQYLIAYSPRYTLRGDHFIYGRAQFESDEFQGYDARYALSGGMGYRLVERPDLKLAIEAGPALRITDTVEGTDEHHISGLGSLDLEWKLAEKLKLTQDASAFVDSGNTTIHSVTALEAGVTDRVAARFSYSVEHETQPIGGTIPTDTLSRFAIVYGF